MIAADPPAIASFAISFRSPIISINLIIFISGNFRIMARIAVNKGDTRLREVYLFLRVIVHSCPWAAVEIKFESSLKRAIVRFFATRCSYETLSVIHNCTSTAVSAVKC